MARRTLTALEPLVHHWRRDRESNPGARICSPLRHHSAIAPRCRGGRASAGSGVACQAAPGGKVIGEAARARYKPATRNVCCITKTAMSQERPMTATAATLRDDDFTAMRQAMVASQLRTVAVTDPRVVAAMADVPRERFVPTGSRTMAYRD